MIRLIVFVLLLSPVGALGQESQPQEEPSLLELARKERERRAQTKKVPVITNATLRDMKGRVSTSEALEPATESEPEAVEQEEPEESPEKDMASWRADFGEARLFYSNAVNRSMVLELKINDLRNSYFREDDGATQGLIQQQIQEADQQLQSARQETQTAREEVQRLQNEARDAGLDPGTVRDLTGELQEPASVLGSQ